MSPPVPKLSPARQTELMLRAQQAREVLEGSFILEARNRPAVFAQMVLKDEVTGKPVRLAPVHKEWQRLATEQARLVLWSHVEAGKTQQMAIARTLWEIGRDTTMRCVILSNTHGQAVKIVRTISSYIEQSAVLHRIFPELKAATPWTDVAITVKRPVHAKDPTVQAAGVHGNILGARIDRLIIDDLLDYENCRTPDGRKQLWEWLQATVMGRLTERAKVCVIGTAFHPEDAMHRFARLPGWKALTFPVLDPTTGVPRWPERWSLERIERRREELQSSMEFARQMLCQAYDDTSAKFKRAWITKCLERGREFGMIHGLNQVPYGCKIYTGVDLAVQQHAAADLTVLTTIAMYPNGDRRILNIESGRWSGPDIVQRIVDAHLRYHSLVIVENNAAQDFIVQFARGTGVPVRAFTTGRNKAHPEFGVEGIAAEMEGGQWIFPCEGGITKELDALISEMQNYDPTAHTGDRLMSLWFAKEGIRMGEIRAEVGRIDLTTR